eukprot:482095_1
MTEFEEGSGKDGRQRRGGDKACNTTGNNIKEDSRFECNVCLDQVHDPVVTRCGHLFCWTCLYRWLHSNHTECPVCKAGVREDSVIPLYVRGSDNVDPRTRDGNPEMQPNYGSAIPNRPVAERAQAGSYSGVGQDGGGIGQFRDGATFTAGIGFFPSLFGLQFQFGTGIPTGHAANHPLTADELQQSFWSRVLLLIGTFIVFCLLFF